MKDSPDYQVSEELLDRIRQAETFLRSEMDKLGLLEREGWRIVQLTRDVEGATEIVLRPIHMRLTAPAGLECVVRVHEEQRKVESHCDSPAAT